MKLDAKSIISSILQTLSSLILMVAGGMVLYVVFAGCKDWGIANNMSDTSQLGGYQKGGNPKTMGIIAGAMVLTCACSILVTNPIFLEAVGGLVKAGQSTREVTHSGGVRKIKKKH